MPSGAVKQLAARKKDDAYVLGLSGLAAWWDASDTDTITASGSDVTAWDDKSGNGITLSAEDADKPQTGVVTQNGLNTLSGFNDTVKRLSSSVSIEDETQTWYVACRNTQNSTPQVGRTPVFIGPRTSSGLNFGPYLNQAQNRLRMLQGSGELNASGAATLPAVILWHCKFTGGASAAFRAIVNGTTVDQSGTVGSSTPASTARIVVGSLSRTTSPFPWFGEICEIIMSTDLHSDAVRDDTLDYLSDKWGTS
jgi:hypothetical protein